MGDDAPRHQMPFFVKRQKLNNLTNKFMKKGTSMFSHRKIRVNLEMMLFNCDMIGAF